MSQSSDFPLKKPPGFHWDFLLLGIILFVCGILGLPFPNGLIPQGPLHTNALCVQTVERGEDNKRESVTSHVVEQRVSHLCQALLFLFTMSGPILTALHQIPQAVLSGLFIVMGLQGLTGNGVVAKIVYLAEDKHAQRPEHELKRVEARTIWMVLLLQIAAFAACFAVTQTIAAIAFPVFIVLMIPVRVFWYPKWLPEDDLTRLDGPVASDFVMQSVGGSRKG